MLFTFVVAITVLQHILSRLYGEHLLAISTTDCPEKRQTFRDWINNNNNKKKRE